MTRRRKQRESAQQEIKPYDPNEEHAHDEGNDAAEPVTDEDPPQAPKASKPQGQGVHGAAWNPEQDIRGDGLPKTEDEMTEDPPAVVERDTSGIHDPQGRVKPPKGDEKVTR